jgi:hypothetical protein
MKTYRAEKLVRGYEFGHKQRYGKFVAIPFENQYVKVWVGDESMTVTPSTKSVFKTVHEDKFGRDRHYILNYYHWKPIKANYGDIYNTQYSAANAMMSANKSLLHSKEWAEARYKLLGK